MTIDPEQQTPRATIVLSADEVMALADRQGAPAVWPLIEQLGLVGRFCPVCEKGSGRCPGRCRGGVLQCGNVETGDYETECRDCNSYQMQKAGTATRGRCYDCKGDGRNTPDRMKARADNAIASASELLEQKIAENKRTTERCLEEMNRSRDAVAVAYVAVHAAKEARADLDIKYPAPNSPVVEGI